MYWRKSYKEHNPEERVLVRSEHGHEELHDVIDCILRVTSGVHEDSSEAGDVSRGRLSDVIEAVAGLGAHGAVSGQVGMISGLLEILMCRA